jgi:hypothetical protein
MSAKCRAVKWIAQLTNTHTENIPEGHRRVHQKPAKLFQKQVPEIAQKLREPLNTKLNQIQSRRKHTSKYAVKAENNYVTRFNYLINYLQLLRRGEQ